MSHAHAVTAHTHNNLASRALLWVAMVFIGFGLLEIIVAAVIGSSAASVFADGIDNLLLDGVVLLGAAWIERKLSRIPGFTSDIGRKISSVVIGAMGPVLYGLSLLSWSAGDLSPLSARETITMLAVGGASYWINQRCHSDVSGHNHAGLNNHLLTDKIFGVNIVLSTIVIALNMPVSRALTLFIGVTTFNIMAWLTWKELGPTIKSLFADVAKLATSWLAAPAASAQTVPAPKPSPSTVRVTMVHDHTEADPVEPVHPDAPKPSADYDSEIEKAVEATAAAIRNLTTLLFRNSETQMGLINGDPTPSKTDSRLPASAVKTIIQELHVLREALVIHSPCLVRTGKGG